MNTNKIETMGGAVNVTVHKNVLKNDGSTYAKVKRATADMGNVIAAVLKKTKVFDEASLVAASMLFKEAALELISQVTPFFFPVFYRQLFHFVRILLFTILNQSFPLAFLGICRKIRLCTLNWFPARNVRKKYAVFLTNIPGCWFRNVPVLPGIWKCRILIPSF